METLAENEDTANSTILHSSALKTFKVAENTFSVENTVPWFPLHQYAIPAAKPQVAQQHQQPAVHHAGNHVRDELCRDDLFNHLLE